MRKLLRSASEAARLFTEGELKPQRRRCRGGGARRRNRRGLAGGSRAGLHKGPRQEPAPRQPLSESEGGKESEREGAADPAPAHAQPPGGGRTFPAGLPGSRQDGDADARQPSQHSARMEIPPTHYPAARAASVVESCINYQQGTPHKVFLVQTVTQASLEEVTVDCTAEVLYPPMGQETAPEVNFTFEGEIGKNPDEEDNTFYQRLKSMKEPLEAQNIPDSFGNVPPEMKPVRHLAWVASGYIIWQNSTENTWYKMAKIQTVKQVQRNDDFIELDYTILLHDIASQEIIPWQMQVLWHPQYGTKVKHNSRLPKEAQLE
ncbi:hypothetical protein Celaphus_00013073 [Cervus elaphus hippelaphus]|uniref:Cystatin LXN-type domain-containing protein n=1 Tax=Cervus elaphus hippelaphus TaxID=46360 RepID=A0A212CIX2_CEREH|nr:hypothetical protein Celaphus_00013073 [Cervus elaphus hippelaphus]